MLYFFFRFRVSPLMIFLRHLRYFSSFILLLISLYFSAALPDAAMPPFRYFVGFLRQLFMLDYAADAADVCRWYCIYADCQPLSFLAISHAGADFRCAFGLCMLSFFTRLLCISDDGCRLLLILRRALFSANISYASHCRQQASIRFSDYFDFFRRCELRRFSYEPLPTADAE